MSDERWNPWKVAAIGMVVVLATALISELVIANWVGNHKAKTVAEAPRGSAPRGESQAPAPHPTARPSSSDIGACNRYASSVTGDKTTEVLKDVLIGGAIGAGVGAAGGAIAGGGGGAGKGAGIGGLVGATAGTLYGLNESKEHDARYVAAYRSCMRTRGYTG